eukprot:CAMPEP_0167759998 /NCGR_PEP_ID=MMETSP0110_2-20121227/11339_1 /TAXON_ID=629695 /ORGANISM="Gymnochlora sp., Strain CCMP2014" /LENGTH=505 /DNA_ID=CAMNT_0007646455 /DNA_START=98 /DNA_END=1615 /DNA_ORIENTATION=+
MGHNQVSASTSVRRTSMPFGRGNFARPPMPHSPTLLSDCDSKSFFLEWRYDDSSDNGHFILDGADGNPMCLDNLEPFGGEGSEVDVYPCHMIKKGEPNQSWDWDSKTGIIKTRQAGGRCLDRSTDLKGMVLTSSCREGTWTIIDDKKLKHNPSGLCLSAIPGNDLIDVPQLKIRRDGVITTGCSNGADFAEQFHIAYSDLVNGACIFSGQPFRCATTKFDNDYLLPQSAESSVPRCEKCPSGSTLVYDHCKNHPWWVQPKVLLEVAREAEKEGKIDSLKNLIDDKVFLFRGSRDMCYLDGSMRNLQQFYEGADVSKESIRLINNLPFPHTLPLNTTPYVDHTEPAGYDGPGHCLDWVYFQNEKKRYAAKFDWGNVYEFDQIPYIDDYNAGFQSTGILYIPKACNTALRNDAKECRLIIYFQACGCGGVANDILQGFGPWAEANDIVIMSPCTRKGPNNTTRMYPGSNEIARGCLDTYGQLNDDYAFQNGIHMRAFGKMLKHLMGE